jgi:glycosyltransferase involved in cell wall biosynthesis
MISVIIPTYNRPDTLMHRAIPSVLAQTHTDWECHVVGDGTDDETVALMEKLALEDPRFRFTNLPHQSYPEDFDARWAVIGLASLNYGIDHALGDWIAVLADDDAWTPDHNEVLLAAAEREHADHVYGISEVYNKAGVSTGQRYGAWPPGGGQLSNGANLYRTSLPFRYDLDCYTNRRRYGDADLWMRMWESGAVRFYFLPHLVLHYHRNWPPP